MKKIKPATIALIKSLIIMLIVASFVILTFTACSSTTINKNQNEIKESNRFKYIETMTIGSRMFIDVYYDTETGVVYQHFCRGNGGGGPIPVYKANGELLTYEEYIENQNGGLE
jgi:hypothetical protein